MNFTIRTATQADANEMMALLPNLTDFELPANRNPDHLWHGDRDMLKSWLDNKAPDTFVLVAVNDSDSVMGVSIVTMREEMLSHEPSSHLEVLSVSSEAHRQGIGQSLITHSEKEAKTRGANSMTLHVFSNNKRARALYDKHGFNGELMRYYKEI